MTLISDPTEAYDRLATSYDCLTAGYENEQWVQALLDVALRHGLRGTSVLDVACGTGSTLLPLVRGGYHAVGVDGSREMLQVAERRLGGAARLSWADMRSLPRLGSFDLVTCLGDALNHLLEADHVEAALAGMAANLARGGLLIFDVNTLRTLRTVFSTDSVASDARSVVVWRGVGDPALPPGGVTLAELTVLAAGHEAQGPPEQTTIAERHHALDFLLDRLWRIGLEPLEVRGTRPGGSLDARPADEASHHKIVIVAGRPRGLSSWVNAHGMERR